MLVVENEKLEEVDLDPDADPESSVFSELTVMNEHTWKLESELARTIRLHQQTRPKIITDLETRLSSAVRGLGFAPSVRQLEAVRRAADESVLVITGVPGSGKTTTLRLLLNTILPEHPVLTAPTGRAARRMSETSGYKAQTLHKALGFRRDDNDGEMFQSGDNDLEDADLIVVDEMSMTDLALAERLFQSVPPQCRVVLIGDPDQLPSVGFGNVLFDLLKSEAVPQVRLDVVFRQGETSQIITNARKIREGKTDLEYGADVRFVEAAGREEAHDKVLELYQELSGKIPADELMVLSPVKGRRRGTNQEPQPAGTIALNRDLQDAVNPERDGGVTIRRGGTAWRAGDRIMELKNQLRHPIDDDEREEMVSNGDTGILEEIRRRKRVAGSGQQGSNSREELVVSFNGDRFLYTADDLDHLDHAYAATIHKAQGSEYEAVVLVLLRQHGRMLQRNLIYTALTRAKSEVYIIAHPAAVAQAIGSEHTSLRRTKLSRRLDLQR